MKTTILLKTLPMLLVLIYAVTRGLPAGRTKQASKMAPASQAPSSIAGVVERVLQDEEFTLALVKGAGDAVWVGTRSTDPVVGQQVAYRIERCIEAYESKKLSMAFEKVLFAEDRAEAAASEPS